MPKLKDSELCRFEHRYDGQIDCDVIKAHINRQAYGRMCNDLMDTINYLSLLAQVVAQPSELYRHISRLSSMGSMLADLGRTDYLRWEINLPDSESDPSQESGSEYLGTIGAGSAPSEDPAPAGSRPVSADEDSDESGRA